jgi:hypothetical protein
MTTKQGPTTEVRRDRPGDAAPTISNGAEASAPPPPPDSRQDTRSDSRPGTALVLAPCDVPEALADQMRLAEQLAYAAPTMLRNLLAEVRGEDGKVDQAASYKQTVGNVIAVMWAAKALNIPLFTALQNAHVIERRIGFSAELGRSLIERAGYRLVPIESTDQKCVLRVYYGDKPITGPNTNPPTQDVSWTIAEAQAAGLVKEKSGWARYPADMLFARCTTRSIRRHCAGVGMGLIRTEDELIDAGEAERLDQQPDAGDPRSVPEQIEAVATVDELRELWARLANEGQLAEYQDALLERLKALGGKPKKQGDKDTSEGSSDGSDDAGPAAGDAEPAHTPPAEEAASPEPDDAEPDGPEPDSAEPARLDCGCVRDTVIETGAHQDGCAKAPPKKAAPAKAARKGPAKSAVGGK